MLTDKTKTSSATSATTTVPASVGGISYPAVTPFKPVSATNGVPVILRKVNEESLEQYRNDLNEKYRNTW